MSARNDRFDSVTLEGLLRQLTGTARAKAVWLSTAHRTRKSSRFYSLRGEAASPKRRCSQPDLNTLTSVIDLRIELRWPVGDFVAAMPTAGWKIFRWKGQWVSLTCFKLPSGQLLYLFVIDEKAFGSRPIPTDFREIGGWQVKFQKESGKVILWASRASTGEVKSYL